MLTVLAFLRRGPPADPVSGWSIATFLLYFDLLEYAGPVQAGLRDPFGWTSARDYRFPEIRSLGGAVLVMGPVLYPYVYLMARTAFRLTPASYYEVAALHDRGIAFPVGLPLARPAIVAGVALVVAGYLLGRGFTRSMATLAPPLLRKSIPAGGLLVFVDVMKELPMTPLPRPFDFETLATDVYRFATDEPLGHSALAIVAAGLGPVIWMNAPQRR